MFEFFGRPDYMTPSGLIFGDPPTDMIEESKEELVPMERCQCDVCGKEVGPQAMRVTSIRERGFESGAPGGPTWELGAWGPWEIVWTECPHHAKETLAWV